MDAENTLNVRQWGRRLGPRLDGFHHVRVSCVQVVEEDGGLSYIIRSLVWFVKATYTYQLLLNIYAVMSISY